MKTKTALILLISVLILVVLGFGISIIYSDYIYNPNGTLSTLQIGIANDTGYIDSTISSKDKQFLVELDQWSKNNQATIIFKDGLTAGAGYCSYSNWEQNNLKITKSGDNPNGVYVLNSQTVLEPYASEGVFLPNMAGLEIAGYYSESLLPLAIKGCDFPNALYELYKGKRASLYICCPNSFEITRIPNERVSTQPVRVVDEIRISDIYEALIEQERLGALKILRHESLSTDQIAWIRKAEAAEIRKRNLLSSCGPMAEYFRKHYPDSWIDVADELR